MAGNKNSGNRNSIESYQFQELIKLGIDWLAKRMASDKTPEDVKDKIATSLVGKVLPQTVAIDQTVTVEHNHTLEVYGFTESDIEQYAETLIAGRQSKDKVSAN